MPKIPIGIIFQRYLIWFCAKPFTWFTFINVPINRVLILELLLLRPSLIFLMYKISNKQSIPNEKHLLFYTQSLRHLPLDYNQNIHSAGWFQFEKPAVLHFESDFWKKQNAQTVFKNEFLPFKNSFLAKVRNTSIKVRIKCFQLQ